MLNIHKKVVVDFYVDEYSAGVWGHNNNQHPICANSRTGFVVTFVNCPLLWVSKLQIDSTVYTLHY